MNHMWRTTGFVVFAVLTVFGDVAWSQWDIPAIGNAIRTQVAGEGGPSQMTVCDNQVHCSVVLPFFYERRDYRPAWIREDGFSANAAALVKAIEGAPDEGLASSDYHLKEIRKMVSGDPSVPNRRKIADPRKLAEMDILLTDTFLIYASHLLSGRVDPLKLDPLWKADRRKVDLIQVLEEALAGNQVEATLRSLVPPHKEYLGLRQALRRYQEMARRGGWQQIPEGVLLKKGSRGEEVSLLRKRLLAEEFLIPTREEGGNGFL